SQDLFGARDRGPVASINFIAAHDGFTIADLTAYNGKHNDANGEGNRDGSNDNRSWNHGIEGPTDDPIVAGLRRRNIRNMLATLLVSTGVPMLCAGDEFGRTQRGSNNAYCQDNEISWFDWELASWQRDLLDTTRFLVGLRRTHPVLRQRAFFSGRPEHEDGSTDLAWYDVDGDPMNNSRWEDPSARTLQMLLDGGPLGTDSLLVVVHGGAHDRDLTLPRPPGITAYELLWDSTWERPGAPALADLDDEPVVVSAASVRIYRAIGPT
ncbi:MAG TPA: hypothetical protein VHM65_00485, partial [Candidatus Lustribacter sp.]|nr:hypothetical protein [Candidatus Lustribacter sp.]